MDNTGIPFEGDLLEENGKIIRKKSLIKGGFETAIAMLIVGVSTLLVPIPYFWLIAVILTGIIVGYYSLQSHPPGHVGQPNTWGQIGSKEQCTGHGVSYSERYLGRKFDDIDIQVKVLEIPPIPPIIVLDKNDVPTTFKNAQLDYQIVDPKAHRLNTTESRVVAGLIGFTREACREEAAEESYKGLKRMTAEQQKNIKDNIKNKLAEEQYWGINVTNFKVGSITASETVEKEDEEIQAREKRMKQVEDHVVKLQKLGIKGKEAIKEWEILNKIVPEEIKTEKRDVNFELGKNVAGLAENLLSLIPKSKKKENEK